MMVLAATNERAASLNHHHQAQAQAISIAASSLSPAPYSVTVERGELERLLSLPSSSPPTPQIITSSSTTTATIATMAPHQNSHRFVPTAVPIDEGSNNYFGDDDDVAVVAIATSVPDVAVASPFFHPLIPAAATTRSNASSSSSNAASTNFRTDLAANLAGSTTTHTTPTNGIIALTSSIRPNPKADSCKNDKYNNDATDNILVVPEVSPPTTSLQTISAATSTAHGCCRPVLQQPPPRTNLRAANVMGTISSEHEIADVARAQRQVRHGLQEQSELAVRVANAKAAVAREENDEGLTVDGGIHHRAYYCDSKIMNTKEKEEENGEGEEDVIPYGTVQHNNGKRGYEVQQYKFSEYDAKGHEYEVSEYKSVYD